MDKFKTFLARRARILLVLIAICLPIGYLGWWHWLAELFSHFFFQYWAASLLVALVLLWVGEARYKKAGVALFCLLSLSLAPYYLDLEGVSAAPATPGLKLLQFNAAQDPVHIVDWLARHPEQADVVLLLEATPDFQPGIQRLRPVFPHAWTHLEYGPFGIALLSKYPLDAAATLDLVGEDYPALAAKITPGGWPAALTLYGIHPPPPISGELARHRDRYMEKLAALVAANGAEPTVVLGDANSTPWSPRFRDFVRASRLRDCQGGLGLLATWPAVTAQYSPLLGIPIDACLVSAKLHVAARHAGPGLGSDHLPVLTELRLR